MDSLIQAVLQATFVSKGVLALLLGMYVASWVYMYSKWMLLRIAQQRTLAGLWAFDEAVESFRNLSESCPLKGLAPVFGVEPQKVSSPVADQHQANKKALAVLNCKGFICKLLWSGKRDLNPQPSAWEAGNAKK